MTGCFFPAIDVKVVSPYDCHIDRGPGWRSANSRHERLLHAMESAHPIPEGAEILLRSLTDLPILSLQDLKAATSTDAICCSIGGTWFLQWSRGSDWIDRRALGGRLAQIAAARSSTRLKSADWMAASAFLRRFASDGVAKIWPEAIQAAQAWWLDRLPRILFAHCADIRRLQPLPTDAFIAAEISARDFPQ
jgi:hypothetical protein